MGPQCTRKISSWSVDNFNEICLWNTNIQHKRVNIMIFQQSPSWKFGKLKLEYMLFFPVFHHVLKRSGYTTSICSEAENEKLQLHSVVPHRHCIRHHDGFTASDNVTDHHRMTGHGGGVNEGVCSVLPYAQPVFSLPPFFSLSCFPKPLFLDFLSSATPCKSFIVVGSVIISLWLRRSEFFWNELCWSCMSQTGKKSVTTLSVNHTHPRTLFSARCRRGEKEGRMKGRTSCQLCEFPTC